MRYWTIPVAGSLGFHAAACAWVAMGGPGSSQPKIGLPVGAAPGLAAIVEFHTDQAAASAMGGDAATHTAMSDTFGAHVAACERDLLEGIVHAAQHCSATIEDLIAAHEDTPIDPSSIVLVPVPALAFHASDGDRVTDFWRPGAPGFGAIADDAAGGVSGSSLAADSGSASSGGAPGASIDGVTNGPVGRTGNRPPIYPPEARRNHQAGRVIVRVVVEADGAVSDASVTVSSGFEALDQAALDAVRTWHFTPASIDGAPIRSAADVPIEFVLRDG